MFVCNCALNCMRTECTWMHVCVRRERRWTVEGDECTQMLARPIITYDYIITGGNKFNFLHCIRYTDSTYDRRMRIGICDAPLLLYFVSHNFDATRVLKHVQAFVCHVSPAPLSLLSLFPMPSTLQRQRINSTTN